MSEDTMTKHPTLDGARESDGRTRFYHSYVSTHTTGHAAHSARDMAKCASVYHANLGPFLPSDRRAAILDLGCGAGPIISYLLSRGYRNVHGVDVSPEQVTLAHELGFSMVEQADAASYLTERSEQFDLITAFDLLEHLTRAELLYILDGVYKALRPHGRFVACTLNMNSPFAGRYRYGDLTHEIAFTPRSIKQALKIAGFVSVTAREVVLPGDNVVRILRRVAWQCIRLGLVAYLAVETGEYKDHVLTLNLIAVADK